MANDRSVLIEGGPTGVLLIHGLGGTPAEMQGLARNLAARGYTVLCCALAGHESEATLASTPFEAWYESARDALAVLEQRCDRIIAGGLSMGALLAALLTARESGRIAGTVMLAPTLRYDGWSIPWYSFLLRLLINTPLGQRYRFAEQEPYGLKDERIRAVMIRALRRGSPDAGLGATPSQALRELWRLVATLKPRLADIRQPTFIAHARNDDVASLKNATYLQSHLGGLVECLVLDDSYHLVTLDRQRELVMNRIAAFIRTLEMTPAGQGDDAAPGQKSMADVA